MKRSLFILITIGLLTNSCQQKDSDPQPQSRTKILLRTWRVQLVAATAIASNRMVAFFTRDAANNLIDHSDHLIQFRDDGTYVASSTSTTNTVVGKWELTANETQLVITPPNHVPQRIADIEELSETQFGWAYSVLEPSQGSLEKSMYDKLKDSYHEDVSKGIKITYRYIP